MDGRTKSEQKRFIGNLTCCQQALYAYIYAQLGSDADSWDVLQETNLYVLKNKRLELDDASFLPWAKAMASAQIRKFRLYAKRRGMHICYDEPTFETVAAALAAAPVSPRTPTMDAFDVCFSRLTEEEREWMNCKYVDSLKTNEMATLFGVSADSVACRLYRIRTWMADCVTRQLCRIREVLPRNDHA